MKATIRTTFHIQMGKKTTLRLQRTTPSKYRESRMEDTSRQPCTSSALQQGAQQQ